MENRTIIIFFKSFLKFANLNNLLSESYKNIDKSYIDFQKTHQSLDLCPVYYANNLETGENLGLIVYEKNGQKKEIIILLLYVKKNNDNVFEKLFKTFLYNAWISEYKTILKCDPTYEKIIKSICSKNKYILTIKTDINKHLIFNIEKKLK